MEAKKKKRTVLKVFGIAFLLLILAGGAFAFSVWKNVSDTADTMHKPLNRTTEKRTEKLDLEKKSPFTVLLLGVDEREGDKGRSDTMIVLSVNPSKTKIKMLSIPRDTRTEMIGKGFDDKINHAYAFGGPEMSMATVENLLDIPLDYYVKINMEGFKDIVDAVDGVTVNNTTAFTYDGTTFNEGFINLNGDEALKYARMRKQDKDGDFGRQNRQRQVIQSIIKKGANVSSLTKYDDILEALGKNIETNLSLSEMMDIQKNYRNAAGGIDQMQLKGENARIDNISYVIIPEEEIEIVQKELKDYLEIKE